MVAYYAHQHGYGHSNLANLFCKKYLGKSLIITSSNFSFDDSIDVVKIKTEDCEVEEYEKTVHNLPDYAHYLPKNKKELLLRNYKILSTAVERNITFAFVDVSVETAIQFRIAGIPYAHCLMFGKRDDLPHRMAYKSAEFLFAYYPKELEQERYGLKETQIFYTGFISRFKFRRNDSTFKKIDFFRKFSVLIIIGGGGTKLTKQIIEKMAISAPMAEITVVGCAVKFGQSNYFKNIDFTDNLEGLILNHQIVIASCGMNLAAELLALKNKFIAVIEERPFEEQNKFCESLIRENLVVTLDTDNVNETFSRYNKLNRNTNLKNFFGSMDKFTSIEKRFLI